MKPADPIPSAQVVHLAELVQYERDRVGEGKQEAYHAMLDSLKDIYGVA